MNKKEATEAKKGNTLKIYDIQSHRSYFISPKDIKCCKSFGGKNSRWPQSHQIHLKESSIKKSPSSSGLFYVGPVTFNRVKKMRRELTA